MFDLFKIFKRQKPIRVLIPVRADFMQWKGGEIYLGNIISLISDHLARGVIEIILVSENADPLSLDFIQKNFSKSAVSIIADTKLGIIHDKRKGFIHQYLPKKFSRKYATNDLYNDVDLTFPVWWSEIGNKKFKNPILWIPDFQHLHLPNYFEKQELQNRDRWVTDISSSGFPVIFSSFNAKQDYLKYYQPTVDNAIVWHFRSSVTYEEEIILDIRKKYNLPNMYFYIPNQFWVHKGHVVAFKALQIVRSHGLPMNIVCTGGGSDYRDPDYNQRLTKLIEELDIEKYVQILGLVPRDDQISIFRCSCSVLQPSEFEGWSTVIEDAKNFGLKIFASDIPIHHEQIGDEGIFFELSNPEMLAQSIMTNWRSLKAGPNITEEKKAKQKIKILQENSANDLYCIFDKNFQRYKNNDFKEIDLRRR